MEKSLTQEQIKEMGGVADVDKELIEATVRDWGMDHGGNADSALAKAMRAYLARTFLEMVPDRRLREDIMVKAACFADGWQYHRPWVLRLLSLISREVRMFR